MPTKQIDPNVPSEHRKGISIYADGGCPDNGSATSMYGTFKLYLDGVNMPVTIGREKCLHPRFDWTEEPHNTSPMAECLTLLKVLDYVRDLAVTNVNKPLPIIAIYMDNKMTVGFANQTMNAKDPHMVKARARITSHPALPGVAVGWIAGEVMKRILGH